MNSQEQVFLEGEADAYFRRNKLSEERRALASEVDPALRLAFGLNPSPKSVLEAGCGDAWRLGVLARRWKATFVGLEPSAEAIEDARGRHPDFRLIRGTLAEIQADGPFDLVIVSFVLHWVSRSTLLRSLSELDRVTAPGGHLLIADFLPDAPVSVPYHHLPHGTAFTYKADYSAMMESTGLYARITRLEFSYSLLARLDQNAFAVPAPPGDRGACTLLRKSHDGQYPILPRS